MELILKKSHTELNKSDASGFTPIQHAAKLGQVKALQFLLKQPGLGEIISYAPRLVFVPVGLG